MPKHVLFEPKIDCHLPTSGKFFWIPEINATENSECTGVASVMTTSLGRTWGLPPGYENQLKFKFIQIK